MRKTILFSILLFLALYLIFLVKYYPNDSDCRKYATSLISKKEYKKIYTSVIDSIEKWETHKLLSVDFAKISNWQMDSILCFNQTKSKVIMALLVPCNKKKECAMDEIYWFYGVKIKNGWYFFQGPSITLIRFHYQEDSSVPLSFSKLHELAVEHIFSGYLYQSLFDKIFRPNHWNINEDFFDQLDDGAYNTPGISKQEYEEIWLRLNKENWSKIDTTNYDERHE